MASQQEYNMMFKLSAQLGKEFGTTFSSAQKSLGETQKQIQALNKQQSDISAYQKQQQSVEATTKKLADLQQQYENIQREIQETEGFSSSLENKLLDKQRAIEKTSASLEHQTQKLDEMGDALRESGIDTDHLKEKSEELTRQMDALADEQAKAAKSAEEYGDAGVSAFEAVGSALVAAGVMKMMTELIGLYKEAIDSSAAYADEIITVSAQYGVSAQELQSYYYAAELVDVSVDTLTKSMAKNIKSMAAARDGSKNSAEAYEALGISVVNTDGTLRDSEKVYWEVIDALGKQTNETERDALAQQLLGKSALELNTLIKAGSGTMKEYAQEAQKAGYILSDDVLATLGALDDAEQKHQNNLTALKNAVGNAVAPELTKLKELENELLSGLTAFVNENPVLVKSIMALTATAAAALAVYTGYVAVKKTLNTVRTISTALRAAETAATVTQTGASVAHTEAVVAETAAQNGLNASMVAGAGLYALLAAAFVAAVAAEVAIANKWADSIKKEMDASNRLTAQSRAEQKQIQELKVEYKKACEVYGETSIEAQSLRAEIEDLEGKYESAKQTVGEFTEEIEASANAAKEAKKAYENTLQEIEKKHAQSNALIDQLFDPSGNPTSNQVKIIHVVDELNNSYSNLGLTYDINSKKFNKSAAELRELVLASKEAEEAEAAWERYTSLVLTSPEKQGLYEKAQREYDEAKNAYDNAKKAYDDYAWSFSGIAESLFAGGITNSETWLAHLSNESIVAAQNQRIQEENLNAAKAEYEKIKNEIAEIESKYSYSDDALETPEENLRKAISAVRKEYMDVATAAQKYGVLQSRLSSLIAIEKKNEESLSFALRAVEDGFMSAAEASEIYGVSVEKIKWYQEIKTIISGLEDLSNAYESTYDAAEKSIKGQYRLWDTAAIVVPKDIEEINNALETQLAYWEDYAKDLDVLRGKSIDGLSDMIAAELSDGSAESVNIVAGMVNATDDQIEKMVDNWRKRNAEQEEVARQYVEIATGFTGELNKMAGEMNSAIEALNLDDEAEAAAKDTVAAYVQAIRDGKFDAVAAAEEMAKLVANALAVSPTDKTANAVNKVQSYINDHNMREGDRARWGQDPEFYKVWSEAVEAVGSADKLHSMVSGANKQTTTATSTSSNLQSRDRMVNSVGGGPKVMELYANGTESARAGFALVGEEGPELVMMHGGEKVLDAQRTESLFGGSVTITISPSFVVNGGDSDIEDRLREFAGEIVEEVKDALEQSGVDSRRSVYA